MASAGRNQTVAVELEKQDLLSFTNDFSDGNFICRAQFCALYHGKIPQGWKGLEGRDVTVKVWLKTADIQDITLAKLSHSEYVEQFNLEIGFLKSDKATSCPYFPRLIAHARDDESELLGVVYDLQSSNTLRHFIDKAEFKWVHRIKVVVGLALLLRHLHDQPLYLVRDLSAAHVMLDKDWNPVLFNCFMLIDRPIVVEGHGDTRYKFGSREYVDFAYVGSGLVREFSDVFAFGVILLELLFKCKANEFRVDGEKRVLYFHAQVLYPLKIHRKKKSLVEKLCCSNPSRLFELSTKPCDRVELSFVDKSLVDPYFRDDDGLKLSELARLCVEMRTQIRPSMMEVVKRLENLQVVRENAEMFT